MNKVNQKVGLLGYLKKAITELNDRTLEDSNEQIQSFEDINSNSELYADAQKILKVQEQLRKKIASKDDQKGTVLPKSNKSYRITTMNVQKNDDERIR